MKMKKIASRICLTFSLCLQCYVSSKPNLKYRPHVDDPGEPEVPHVDNTKAAKKASQLNRLSRVQRRFRCALLSSITISEIQEIMAKLIQQAKNGNITAAREVLDRAVGKAAEQDIIDRLAELEVLVTSQQHVVDPPEAGASRNSAAG